MWIWIICYGLHRHQISAQQNTRISFGGMLHPSSRVPHTWRTYGKEHWSYYRGLWWNSTLLIHFIYLCKSHFFNLLSAVVKLHPVRLSSAFVWKVSLSLVLKWTQWYAVQSNRPVIHVICLMFVEATWETRRYNIMTMFEAIVCFQTKQLYL